MRRRAAVSIVASLALICGGLAVAAPATAANHTSLTLVGDAGDYITGGGSFAYAAGDVSMTTSGTTAYVGITATVAGGVWNLDFRAPSGSVLTAGTTYTGAQRAPFATPPNPGIDITGFGRGCNTQSGSFTVHEIVADAGTGEVTQFAATFEQHCEGGVPAARGSVFLNSSLEPTTLDASAPTTAVPGSTVTVAGSLVSAAGAVASATIDITRTDGAGTTTPVDATTGVDGTFSFQDVVGSTDVTYVLSYAGDASHAPSTKTVVVQSRKKTSALALTAPTTVKRATTYTLGGTLTSGGTAVRYATLSVTRKDLAGSRTFSLKTGSAGTFSYKDTPAVGGTVSWTVSWAGSATQASARATRSVSVVRAATTLSITTDKTVYTYGTKAYVKVKLGTTYNNRVVSIYAKKANSATTSLIARGKVSSTGYLTASFTMTAKTTFTAKYAGDYRYTAATKATSPNTRAKVSMQVFGNYGTSGSYKLVGLFGTAYFLATVSPARPGACVDFVAQELVGGVWRTYDTLDCASLDGNSQYAVSIAGNGYAGKVRVRASVGANAYSASNVSPWGYVWFR